MNPFRYGALALDEAFTNREDEIRELTRDILNGQDVVVLAPRRYGKTSLLWRVIQEVGHDLRAHRVRPLPRTRAAADLRRSAHPPDRHGRP